MNLKQNLIITYSNQKARELKKSLKNPLDKVVTLSAFVNEFFEKHSFKTLIKPIIATSFIYKTIKDENIEYLDFISLNSNTLDLIYDFILKANSSKVDLLNKKDKVYAKLGDYKSFKIEENQSLKQWCTNHINSGKKVDMEIMKNIEILDKKFHENLQNLVEANANKESNETLNKNAKDVEMDALRIFGNLNNVKREACKK